VIHVVTIGKSTVRVLIKYEYSSTSTAVVAYSCTRVLVVGTFTGYRLPVHHFPALRAEPCLFVSLNEAILTLVLGTPARHSNSWGVV